MRFLYWKGTVFHVLLFELARFRGFIYLLWLPWTLLNEFGYYTIFIVALSSFVLLGVEAAAADVDEGPFMQDRPNHVDVDGLCLAIHRDISLCMKDYVSNLELQAKVVIPQVSNHFSL